MYEERLGNVKSFSSFSSGLIGPDVYFLNMLNKFIRHIIYAFHYDFYFNLAVVGVATFFDSKTKISELVLPFKIGKTFHSIKKIYF